jgi:hypothetical protein
MSGATYRIEIAYESEMSPGAKWRGKVYRASDDSFVGSVFRDTPENAARAAREYIAVGRT